MAGQLIRGGFSAVQQCRASVLLHGRLGGSTMSASETAAIPDCRPLPSSTSTSCCTDVPFKLRSVRTPGLREPIEAAPTYQVDLTLCDMRVMNSPACPASVPSLSFES